MTMNSPINPELPAPGETLPARQFQADDQDLFPRMVTTVAEAKRRLEELQSFIRDIMVEDKDGDGHGDYGKLPGMKRLMLYKAGAEKLLEAYGYRAEIAVTHRVEKWEDPAFFHYEVLVTVFSKRSGNPIGQGVGSCNSREAKYRWRSAQRSCPTCAVEALISGRPEFGRGKRKGERYWVCLSSKGGCNEQFDFDDKDIVDQVVGKVETPDAADLCNTILKMSSKRGYVAVTLSVTRSSDLFMPEDDGDSPDKRADPRPDPKPEGPLKTADGKYFIVEAVPGRIFHTAGVGKETLQRIWKLVAEYDKIHGGGAHKKLLKGSPPINGAVIELQEADGLECAAKIEAAIRGPGEPPADVEVFHPPANDNPFEPSLPGTRQA